MAPNTHEGTRHARPCVLMGLARAWVGSMLVAIVACTPESPPDSTTPFMPMAVGLTRRYEIHAKLRGGKELQGEVVQTVNGLIRIDGLDYFQSTQTTTVPGAGAPIVGFHRIDAQGVHFKLSDSPEWLLVPAHPRAGDTWNARTPDVQQFSIDGFEDVVVGSRTYHHCLVIRASQDSTDIKMRGVSYYAPNVGLVKATVDRHYSNGIGVTSEMLLNNGSM